MYATSCNLRTVSLIFIGFIYLIGMQSCGQNGKSGIDTNIVTDLFTKNTIDVKEVGKAISASLNANNNTFVFAGDTLQNTEDIASMYVANKNEAIWLSGKGLNQNAISFLKNLENLAEDGLNVKKFHINELFALQKKIESNNLGDNAAVQFDMGMSYTCMKACDAMINGQFEADSFNEDWFNKTDTFFNASKYVQNSITSDSIAYLFDGLRPTIPIYQKLKTKLKELKAIEKKGGWSTITGLKDSLQIGFTDKNVSVLRKRLFSEIGIPKDTNSEVVNDDLQIAIHSFQYLHDLKLTGKLDTSTLHRLNIAVSKKIKNMQSNLERLRWVQKDLQQPYVWVNIPKMELQYIDADSVQFKMRTVVGRTSRPTPTLNAMMSNIVINPNWSVPPTIMKEEVVPGIGKRGGSYLSRRGLKAFYRGREVSGDRINAKNFKMFSIQQKPGLNSALGAVKFNMPNRHAIYLHDTPHREDFVKYYRAYSSGCIRVEKPRDFATFILNDSNYSKLKIDTFIRKKITKEVPLKKKVEVHIVYLTNGLDSLGNVMYLRDIYNKDGKMEGIWE